MAVPVTPSFPDNKHFELDHPSSKDLWFETSVIGNSWWGLGCHGKAVSATHPVHCLSDEGVVSEAFEEGKWLVYGIGNLQLLVYEVLE